jgi:hypothetical protein
MSRLVIVIFGSDVNISFRSDIFTCTLIFNLFSRFYKPEDRNMKMFENRVSRGDFMMLVRRMLLIREMRNLENILVGKPF